MDCSVLRPLHTPTCTVSCSGCNLKQICLPLGLTQSELDHIDGRLVALRRKVLRGERLFQAGDRFEAVYAVWTGFFKTCVASKDGREQVTGFQMGGEMIGLDGIGSFRHEVDAVALEDSQVCVIPFSDLELLAHEVPSLQQQLHRAMSREIVRSHGVMLLLGSMYAEERLAAFLLNLTNRLQARGFSAHRGAAHEPRRDRQLPGPEARNREPHLLQVPGQRPALCAPPPDPRDGPGGSAAIAGRREHLVRCFFEVGGEVRVASTEPNSVIQRTSSYPAFVGLHRHGPRL
jgi:CRP/FNR family transcriptional regulator